MYDVLIKNATLFNNQEPVVIQDIAIEGGRIVKRAASVEGDAKKVVDATGLYAMPGLFDIHTHYDLELEVDPALPE